MYGWTLAHRGAFQEVSDAGGTFLALRPPFRFKASEIDTGARVASLGEHTREVLEETGLTGAEIDALIS